MLTFNTDAQTLCETSSYSPYKDLILNTYKTADFTSYSFCIKIYIHVVRRDDGSGGQSIANVYEALTYLDNAYNPYFIFFNWDNYIHYINNTEDFNHPYGSLDDYTYDHADGVDIYLFDDSINHPITLLGYGATEFVGYSSKLLVTGSFGPNLEYPLVRSHILSHEMGHVLNLWHTHHGTGEDSGDPDQCPEYPNGSNSATCGDYITDTPADPNMEYDVDLQTCEWLGDANSPYDPDELNILSYTQPVCMEYLTFQQSRRMKTALYVLPFLQDVSTYITYHGNPCTSPSLNYYPNSANQELNLDLTNKPVATYNYELYDNYGVLVDAGQSQNILKTIDTSTLLEGIYFLHFYENGELTIKQIIIEH